jgi:DNA-binding transcriptional LysR family regulator
MAKLNLEWIEVFVQIYNTQNVSRAAVNLGMEQASASIVLNKLRQHFGDRLLKYLEKARGQPTAFAPLTASRAFRICMTDISEIVILPKLVNYLQNNAPNVQIEAETITDESRYRLASGDVDLAIGFLPNLDAGFYQQSLFEQDFVCLAANNHPRVKGKLGRRLFANEGHILVSTAGTGHAIIEKSLAREKITRRVVLRVPSFLGVARIVSQTEFLVVVPRQLGIELAALEAVQVLEPPIKLPHYKVKQHWHERFNAESGSVWMRQTVAKLFMGA